MSQSVVLLSIPGLRSRDLGSMPRLLDLSRKGVSVPLVPSFPAVTCSVQANLTTGVGPEQHGIIGNGFYWRDRKEVELWTAWNDKVQRPQLWETLQQKDASITSAVWFAMLSKAAKANFICTPAPIHNPEIMSSNSDGLLWEGEAPAEPPPGDSSVLKTNIAPATVARAELSNKEHLSLDAARREPRPPSLNPRSEGSESLWCYTKPTELYGALRDSLGDFPLKHFWGPLADIKSTAWIVDSFIQSAYVLRPRFSDVYLPHLDYAAQKFGPDSTEAQNAIAELDLAIGALVDGFTAAGIKNVTWLAASEYCITPVSSVGYPNRVLREAGLLAPELKEGFEHLVPGGCRAFAMVDHQLAHVYVRDSADIPRASEALKKDPTVAEVLVGAERSRVGLNHERSGEIVLVAKPESWFAYYWWLDETKAPPFARTVDIHRKPGYDPVELFIDDGSTGNTPLDATLVKGSHGQLADEASREGVLVSSESANWFSGRNRGIRDVDVSSLVHSLFGLS